MKKVTWNKLSLKSNKILLFALAFVMIFNIPPTFTATAYAQMSFSQMSDSNIVAVSNGSYHILALDDEGVMWSWGEGFFGKLGNGGTSIETRPQKITTDIDGNKMPAIKQISSSQQNCAALDVDGNVWTWGLSSNGSLGRAGSNTRPGKVEGLPAISYISSAYLGGRAVGVDGSLWVWGRNYQYSLGDDGSTDSPVPKRLTTGFDSNGLATVDLLQEKFIAVEASDYFDMMCNMAVTETGTIYTWGNNNVLAAGGSTMPKQVTSAHSSSSVGILPTDIRKIRASNGGFSFLDGEGNIWTWGSVAVINYSLGHGNNTPYNLPKRVDNVRVSGITQAAPKFVDYSRYAWEMVGLDEEGNIYACGEEMTGNHNGLGAQNTLTRFSKPILAADNVQENKIIQVCQGYFSTSCIDLHGNLYVISSSVYFGTRNTVVQFPDPPTKIRFKNIQSTPPNDIHAYTKDKAVLTVTVVKPVATSNPIVKYVKIYPKEDPELYALVSPLMNTGGHLQNKILIAGSNPQKLISESYDLPSSQFYANTQISEKVFNDAYAAKLASGDAGLLETVTVNSIYTLKNIQENCVIWLQTEGTNEGVTVTNRMLYPYNNFYKNVEIYHQGVKDNGHALYTKEIVLGNYGLYYNHDGTFYEGEPPLGYDTVTVAPKTFTYWKPDPSDTESGQRILDNESYANNDTVITFKYVKDPENWWDTYVYYIRHDNLESVEVNDEDAAINPKPLFAPKNAGSFNEGESPFYAPAAVDTSLAPVGYILMNAPGTPNINDLEYCDFPDEFDPNITANNQAVYIVYKSGTIKITEEYWIEAADGTLTEMSRTIQPPTQSNVDAGSAYGPKNAIHILGYAAVDFAVDIITNRQNSQLGNVSARIDNVTGDRVIFFIYKIDSNNNGIPDEYEGRITVRWIGKHADGTPDTTLFTNTFIANGKAGDTLYLENNGISKIKKSDGTIIHEETLNIPLTNWIFSSPLDPEPYAGGSDTPLTLSFVQGASNNYIFYYDIDENGNTVADRFEGHITVYYQDINGSPIAGESYDKYLENERYVKKAPDINNWVAVDVKVGSDLENLVSSNTPIGVKPIADFNVSINGNTVVFVYQEDLNNNGIPDSIEGTVTIQWVGVTAGGTEITLSEQVFNGYGGGGKVDSGTADVSLFTPSSQWLFDDGSHDSPPRDVIELYKYTGRWYFDYSFDHNNPQVFKFYYDEDYNQNGLPDRLEPIKITVVGLYNNNEIYSHTINKGLAERPFDIEAWTLPTYKLFNGFAEQYTNSQNGSIYPVKPEDLTDVTVTNTVNNLNPDAKTITVNPRIGSQTVYFDYKSNMTVVTIKAMYGDTNSITWTNTPIPAFTEISVPAEIGKPFSFSAPYIDGYTNTAAYPFDASGGYIASINENGNDVITFYYVKNTGNLQVIAYEDLNGNGSYDPGEEIGNTSVLLTGSPPVPIDTSDINAPSAADITSLNNYNLVAGSGESTMAEYNGIDNVTLMYQYTRKTRNVIAEAYDIQTGSRIGYYSMGGYGVSQTHYINAPSNTEIAALANYTLQTFVSDNPQCIVIDSASESDIIVKFWYKPKSPGSVTVVAYWNNGEEDIELQRYTNVYPVGIPVNIESPVIQGWKLASSGTDSIGIVTVVPDLLDVHVVKFRYIKDVATVTVVLTDNNNAPLTAPAGYATSYEVLRGFNFTAYAPHIPGYVIDNLQSHTLFNVQNDETITFVYKPIITIIPQVSTVLEIYGEDTDNPVSSYRIDGLAAGVTMQIGKIDLTAFGYAFDYSLPEANDEGVIIFTPDVDSSQVIRLYYKRMKSNVTVNYYDVNDPSVPFKSVTRGEKIGSKFTADTNAGSGYIFLNGNSNITVDVDSDSNIINLNYVKVSDIQSNTVYVKHIAAEPDDFGRVWVIDSETITGLTELSYRYDADNSAKVMGIISKGYNLTGYSNITVDLSNPSAESFIELYYEPNLQPYQIQYINVSNSEILETVDTQGYIGAPIPMPDARFFRYQVCIDNTDYLKQNNGYISLDTNVVKVFYENTPHALVSIYYIDADTDEVIHTTELEERVGNVFVYQPSSTYVHNNDVYRITSDSNKVFSIVVGNEPSLLEVHYKKEEAQAYADVTIYYQNKNGSIIRSFVVKGKTIGEDFSYTADYAFDLGNYRYSIDSAEQLTKTIKLLKGNNEIRFSYNVSLINYFIPVAPNSPVTSVNYVSAPVASQGPEVSQNPVLKGSHIPYIRGYDDGTLRPDSYITRAEAAQGIYNLINDPAKGNVIRGQFMDVDENAWYAQAVNYLTHRQIINGYEDGTFKPDAMITRAEYTVLAVLFKQLPTVNANSFPDVPNYWFTKYIDTAYANGWVTGYPDGTFRPNANITRAEYIVLTNKMLDRTVDGTSFKDIRIYVPFNDINSLHWAYYAILEASVLHEYTYKNGWEVWSQGENN